MDEILRLLEGLQVADENNVALTLNFRKGDKVIVPPPKTLDEMQERIDNTSYDKIDFFPVRKNFSH